MKDITIRAARLDDLEALNQMMYDLHDFHHQANPALFKTAHDVEQEKSIARYLDHPECFVFVAQTDQLVGFISGHFCELMSPIVEPVQMGSIDEMFVVSNHRNQGVAQLLFDRIQQSFIDCGVEQLFVEAWDFNQPALGFYKKSGFINHIHYLRKPLV
ncbi:GNAT family N-acetyltransferase [Vibrio sp. SCSIO 43136]|uniref:GNAT family N-acetyltransferase n=1 Tax=Vibrio sp. SCSIO 43136 TaxID=2819101 RepID=UPI00207586D6|nr:GNAT family N-acetyltransferase [Vibrio sp. SCSIO 43136]USD66493.1 GNAT family N-acetyltransferase [Vibrio sp. SCSIO 43136]